MTETIELPRVLGPGSGLGGWRVIVLNDDHNTFDHVAETLARYIPGVNVSAGHGFANRIHTTGQAIVWSRAEGARRALLGAAGGLRPHDGPARAGLARAASSRCSSP